MLLRSPFFVVDISVEIQFHIPSATWMSDTVKEKLLKRVRIMFLQF